jgi:hypothetical protein
MLIVWIKKSRRDPQSAETEEQRAARHNADMKRFRAAHADLNIVDARDVVTADGNLLALAQGVKLPANAQN